MSRVMLDSSSEDELQVREPSPVPAKRRRRALPVEKPDSPEPQAPVSPPPLPPKKRGLAQLVDVTERTNERLRAAGLPGTVGLMTFCGQRVGKDAGGNITFTPDPELVASFNKTREAEALASTSSAPPRPTFLALKSKHAPAAPTAANEAQWQSGMEMALSMLVPLKVDHKGLTLLPDNETLECFKKAAQAFLTEKKIFLPLTFSSNPSFKHLVARFLYHFIMKASGIGNDANPSGCVVWKHGCEDSLHCLHGLTMIQKEALVEMDLNSEAAQRVLKETPERAKVTPNRWGRNVVQIKNEDAYCCPHDVNMPGTNNYSPKSCGLSFTDGNKALMAFKQFMEFQGACYPKMATSRSHMLIPLKCECNWNNSLPLLGRQVCKLTPFAVQATSHVDKSLIDDPKMLATLNHPAMLVFQCCNPVYKSSKANPQKNCDFKVSVVDVMGALQVAKQMWGELVKSPVPTRFPEFKWAPEFQVQNTILPQGHEDGDDSLF